MADDKPTELCPDRAVRGGLASGDVVDNKFEILAELGSGGIGTVYEAKHLLLGKSVAIKILQPHGLLSEKTHKRFSREALLTSELSHPNIVAVREFGIDSQNRPYLVMEYLQGISLDKLIGSGITSNSLIYLRFASQIAQGMAHAHEQNIVHRDLKASNVIVSGSSPKDYVARIVDFGIARMTTDEESSLTKTGEIVGTPNYMSPEQATGRQADERSDIYSFGCLLYEMCEGRPPFSGDSMMAVISQHIHSTAPRGTIASDIWPLIERCMAKKPEDRYQDFAEIVDDIALIESGKQLRRSRLVPGVWRKQVLATGVALLALGSVGLFVVINRDTLQTIVSRLFPAEGTPEDQLRIAASLGQHGNYTKALAICEHLLERDPKLYEALVLAGLILSHDKAYEKATSYFDRALSINSSLTEAYIGRGENRLRMGDFEGAVSDFTESLQLKPQAGVYCDRGIALQRLGEHSHAIMDFTQALALRPGNAAVLINRGLSRSAVKDYIPAMEDFQSAIKIHPRNLAAYLSRCSVYLILNKLDGAMADANKAIAINSSSPIAYNNRGYVYYRKGRNQEALEDLNKALQLAPTYDEAYASRGDVYSSMGSSREALADYNRALELNSKNASALRGKAFLKNHPTGGRPPQLDQASTTTFFK
jgi:serine/threonine protein kinase/tetratricopeptide (TPR) repeat protein